MMMLVSIVALCAILLIASCASVFFKAPRDVGDVYCFLAMLVACVALVLVFVVKGFWKCAGMI